MPDTSLIEDEDRAKAMYDRFHDKKESLQHSSIVVAQVSNALSMYLVGISLGMAYAHPNSGDTVASVMIGGLRTVRNGHYAVHTNDLLVFYFDDEMPFFDAYGARLAPDAHDNGELMEYIHSGGAMPSSQAKAIPRTGHRPSKEVQRHIHFNKQNGNFKTRGGKPEVRLARAQRARVPGGWGARLMTPCRTRRRPTSSGSSRTWRRPWAGSARARFVPRNPAAARACVPTRGALLTPRAGQGQGLWPGHLQRAALRDAGHPAVPAGDLILGENRPHALPRVQGPIRPLGGAVGVDGAAEDVREGVQGLFHHPARARGVSGCKPMAACSLFFPIE